MGSILIGQEHDNPKPPTIGVWDGQADQNTGTFTLVLQTRDGVADDPGSWRYIRGIVVAQDHRRKCLFELGEDESLRDNRLSVPCQSGIGGLALIFKDNANEAIALWQTGSKSIELHLLRRERIDPSALAGDWVSNNRYRVCTVHVQPFDNPFVDELERFTAMMDGRYIKHRPVAAARNSCQSVSSLIPEKIAL